MGIETGIGDLDGLKINKGDNRYWSPVTTIRSQTDSSSPYGQWDTMGVVFLFPEHKTLLRRNNLNTIDILDYGKIRSVMSTGDIAELVRLNKMNSLEELRHNSIIKHLYSCLTSHWDNWCETDKRTGQDTTTLSESEARKERWSVIDALAYSDPVKNDVMSRLTIRECDLNELVKRLGKEETNLGPTSGWDTGGKVEVPLYPSKYLSTYHRIEIMNSREVAIILERGFLNALENRDYAKAFVSDYLKTLYSLYPIASVSAQSIFKTYLELL